jgi:hypothetical protein
MESQSQRARLEDRVVAGTAALNEALVRLNVAHEETVLRLAKAIEYRDPETGTHIERMSHYCALLGESFDLDPEAMRLASRLHDVGKISIADSILLKPGPLTPDERREMERHAEIGYRVLRGSQSQILDLAATIAWTHHERFDGSGYPRGLRGDAIPLAGQIAGLADMFDALTTDRVYRPARSVEEAVALLTSERGTGFAEVIVDAFVAKLGEVEAIMARFAGEPATAQDPVLAEESAPHDVASLQDAAAAVAPPAGSHTAVADVLRARGPEIVQRAAASLYEECEGGWFLGDEETTGTRSWLCEVVRACETGRHAGALEATRLLMQRAHLQGATLFEQHGFLEHFGDTVQRLLVGAGVASSEVAASRRLWTSHRQALLAARG